MDKNLQEERNQNLVNNSFLKEEKDGLLFLWVVAEEVLFTQL